MNTVLKYYQYTADILKGVAHQEEAAIEQAAALMSASCAAGGRIYVFGSGHSHMIAEEVYARAGGLAMIKAILPQELMVIDFPTKSTGIERLSGYSASLLNLYKIDKKDTLLVISNSGRNPVPVEMAQAAREKGAKVVAITSLSHSKQTVSRAPSGLRLFEVADVVIDNHAPKGDAGFYIEGCKTPVGPVSTLTGVFIAQALICQVVEDMVREGMEPPVFVSSNVDEGDAFNQKLFETYYGYWK